MEVKVCSFCADMTSRSEGCSGKYVKVNDTVYERIVYNPSSEQPKRCPECNAKIGRYHHARCPEEKCPVCRLSILTCKCKK